MAGQWKQSGRSVLPHSLGKKASVLAKDKAEKKHVNLPSALLLGVDRASAGAEGQHTLLSAQTSLEDTPSSLGFDATT